MSARRLLSAIRRVGRNRALFIGTTVGVSAVGIYFADVRNEQRFKAEMQRYFRVAHADESARTELNKRSSRALPTRRELLNGLMTESFDVLVIGGGATGAGVALDATTRGLKTALVELDDFSSGTSSRSTKLIHGGVRYLQAAIMGFDREQYRMVKEALFERANLLDIAPHLSHPLPIMLPVYSWWQIPYYWVGIKAYDLVSGRRILKHSYFLGKEAALERFPMLKKDSLKGALVYYDGAHNDARMNLAIVLSAIRQGARAANHVQVERLLKNEDGTLCGAHVRDTLTNAEWDIQARAVVNATGAFTDSIRQMADATALPICAPSAGVHIVLPGYYTPSGFGLLDPATSDGRVIFFLPWQKMTIAGTTDASCEVSFHPAPANRDIEFILKEVRNYLSPDISIRRGDVMSAWSGLRPLVRDPNKADTKSLARNHIIEVCAKSKLITIAGGKWTTYRHMAEETVDRVINEFGMKTRNGCVTAGLKLDGGHEWNSLLYINLVQDYGIDVDVAQHLVSTYGDRAFVVARMCKMTGKRWPIVGERLQSEFPYLEAEVRYAVREYACSAIDVIARRLRLAFLNTYAAHEVLDSVVSIMAEELKWSPAEASRQLDAARKFIDREMGQEARAQSLEQITLNLTRQEMKAAKKRFEQLAEGKDRITVNDIRRYFRDHNAKIDERQLHELLNEVDMNKNGSLELSEFYQLYSGLKSGQITQNRLVRYLDEMDISTPAVERSGGGV